MNLLLRVALLATLLVTVTGCYHATIDTGRTPSTRVIDERWASGWVLGLVPPKTVETAAECADGVAMVETKLGFLNQVVGILTIGIYTPMHIKVTCAAPRRRVRSRAWSRGRHRRGCDYRRRHRGLRHRGECGRSVWRRGLRAVRIERIVVTASSASGA